MNELVETLYDLVETKLETFEEAQAFIQEEIMLLECRYCDKDDMPEGVNRTYNDLFKMVELLDDMQMLLYPIERGSLPREFKGYDWGEE